MRAGRRTIGAHGGVISPADGAGCHGVRADRLGPNLSAPTFLERTADNGRSSAAQRAAGSSGSGWNAVWEPSQILISLIREFWPDSLLEEDGFEPSVPRERGVVDGIETPLSQPLSARRSAARPSSRGFCCSKLAQPLLGFLGREEGVGVWRQLYPIQPPRLRGGGRGCARSQWSEAKRALTPSE